MSRRTAVARRIYRLGDITAPTLVMGASRTGSHRSTARVWTDGIEGARTVTYSEAGHMPMLEVPGRSAADYRAFLSRVREPELSAQR